MNRNSRLIVPLYFIQAWLFCCYLCQGFIPHSKTYFSQSCSSNIKGIKHVEFCRPKNNLQLKLRENNEKEPEIIPYVVQVIERNTENTFREVSAMCIEVFFNEGTLLPEEAKKQPSSPSKGLQLAYLRNAQYSDLRSRMFFASYKNTMIVARRVLLKSTSKSKNKSNLFSKVLQRPGVTMPIEPIDFDTSKIYNKEYLPRSNNSQRIENESYVAGEILGFCEVSARPIGLAAPDIFDKESKDVDDNTPVADVTIKSKSSTSTPLRPLLTNLAVQKYARKSGIGSQLLSKCEAVVSAQWNPNYKELVLQVEEDNPNAISFYQKRGYQTLYADKSARRFDTSGLLLRQVRSTKVCMRKSLNQNMGQAKLNGAASSWGESVTDFLTGLRKTILTTTS